MQVDDVSPTVGTLSTTFPPTHQSASGKALCVAMSRDGNRVYVGGHSGVWISEDGGETFYHSEQIQPYSPAGIVPGSMLSPNVYDLVISPSDNDLVLAATGRDGRVPTKAGIYRSEDGARSWKLVHQFFSGLAISGDVGRIVFAPDNDKLVFAAGGFAVGISNDGGTSWNDVLPGSFGDKVWYVVVGRQEGTLRRVYAVGTHVWYSKDGGNVWHQDAVGLSIGAPSDFSGFGSTTVSIHPTNSSRIYIARRFADGHVELWRGDFSNFDVAGQAEWIQLAPIPINYPGTTPSGCTFIIPHVSNFSQTLYLIASDSRTTHISIEEPGNTSDWMRIDNSIHLDPHGVSLTPDFEHQFLSASTNMGKIAIVNDGGFYYSIDGTKTWKQGNQLSNLTILNMAILPRPKVQPAFCIGTTDNSGFFSFNGGLNWKTQDYRGGDNDWCFSDPLQPSRLIVFAPRNNGILLYRSDEDSVADGTVHGRSIPEPPRIQDPSVPGGIISWNVRSNHANIGYRPVILTLVNELSPADGDFITVYSNGSRTLLLRTFVLSEVTNSEDWIRAPSSGIKVWAEGPDLPDLHVNVVQPSGGHETPTYYVADLSTPSNVKVFLSGPTQERLWKWNRNMVTWERIVPPSFSTGPLKVKRFFVDPYRPEILYVLDTIHIFRSEDSGVTWTVDSSMESALTENGAYPFAIGNTTNAEDALVRDMTFDPYHSNYRFAAGPAGVYYTSDGVNWKSLIRTAANPMHPTTLTYDFVSNPYIGHLYVSTSNRGLLKLPIRTSLLSLRVILTDRGFHFPVSIATITQIFGRPRPISLQDFFSRIKRN